MTSQSRKHRGYATQSILARWFQRSGWPYAESVGAGRAGADITGMPGIAVEAKARRGLNLTGWLKQATGERRHGLPILIVRPDGYGEAKVGEWPAIMTLADLTELLREAGYGDPIP